MSNYDAESQVDTVTRINAAEFLYALGLGGLPRGRSVLERLVWPQARQIARDMAHFDAILGDRGLHVGANNVLAQLSRSWT